MTDCCTQSNAKLVIRARENTETWGNSQVLECRTCGQRWAK